MVFSLTEAGKQRKLSWAAHTLPVLPEQSEKTKGVILSSYIISWF